METSDRAEQTDVTPAQYPKSLREAVLRLVLALELADLERIAKLRKRAADELHFGLGTWVRNNFGLWSEGSELMRQLGCVHADDASGQIIDALLAHTKKHKNVELLRADAAAELQALLGGGDHG